MGRIHVLGMALTALLLRRCPRSFSNSTTTREGVNSSFLPLAHDIYSLFGLHSDYLYKWDVLMYADGGGLVRLVVSTRVNGGFYFLITRGRKGGISKCPGPRYVPNGWKRAVHIQSSERA